MHQTSEDPALQPPLDEYQRQLRTLQEDARELLDGLSPAQINWSPGAGQWSIAECLDHIDLTARSYVVPMETAIAHGRAKGKVGGAAKYGPLERWFIRSLEPPVKQKMKAPKKIVPVTSSFESEELLSRFLESKEKLIELLALADGLDLGKVKVTSPIISLLKLRLGAAFGLLVAHGRRHIWQARQVQKGAGFPAA